MTCRTGQAVMPNSVFASYERGLLSSRHIITCLRGM